MGMRVAPASRCEQRALYVERVPPAMRAGAGLACLGSVNRLLPEIIEPVHRPDLDLANIDSLQQAKRNFAARRAARPHLAIEIRLRANARAADGENDVALLPVPGDDDARAF